jgi:hypothetical protein
VDGHLKAMRVKVMGRFRQKPDDGFALHRKTPSGHERADDRSLLASQRNSLARWGTQNPPTIGERPVGWG